MVSIRTPQDAAATENRIGSIGDGDSENSKAQVGPFGGLLPFLRILRLADRNKTPALLTEGI